MSKQDPFQPDSEAFSDTPLRTIDAIKASYNSLGQVLADIVDREYFTGKLRVEMMPVSKTRVMCRIFGEEEDTSKARVPNATGTQIEAFLRDLQKLPRNLYEIYFARDVQGFNVISFEAQDMLNALKHLTKGKPQEIQYWSRINFILTHYQEHSSKVGLHIKPN